MTARLRLRGVRGSTPTPQIENLRFGGNTSCVEVATSNGDNIIFDAGSGIRNLGINLLKQAAGQPLNTHIFLTHFHWDHIQGIPFFAPVYGPKNHIEFHAARTTQPLAEILEGQMTKPYFPIDFTQVGAKRTFHEHGYGDTIEVCGLTIRPFQLNHPQTACGYRIETGSGVIVYATDYEHGVAELDRTLVEYADGADVLICDAQYTPEEYEKHRGWGHSTWLNAVNVAREAKAKQLLLFHHDPGHDDDTMAAIAEQARGHFANTEASREGSVIEF